MKKAGIITFHNAENYGAALQTFALMKTVQNMGCECKVVDYRNLGVFYRNTIKNLYYLFTFQNPGKNHRLYKKFQQNFMNLTDKSYRRISDFEQDADQFDLLFFGSDQIWNPDLSNGFDNLYFGQFSTTAKKIAYGASIGKDDITRDERRKINHLISAFDAIAVREETMLPIIDRDVSCVVDPCMLLPVEEWKKISNQTVDDEDFLFVYQLHPNQNVINSAVSTAKKLGKKVLVISPYLVTRDRDIVHKLGRISPNDFLAYFQHADMVFSDSFHGTVFSVLFEKHFYVILPSEKTGRITSLLNRLGLSDRIINKADIDLNEIDYTKVNPLVHKEIETSLAFIRRNLK